MKSLLCVIFFTFIAFSSRGIHSQFFWSQPRHDSRRSPAFILHTDGNLLKSVDLFHPEGIRNLHLDLHLIDSIQPNAFVNLSFDELHIYNSGQQTKKLLNFQPVIFNGTDVKMLTVRNIYFPVRPNPFGTLKSVRTLQLSDNDFNSFPIDFFADFPYLTDLEWKQRNACQTISPILFSKINKDLNVLVIEDRITVIEPNSFDRFKSLKKLVLHADKLDYLRRDMFSGLHSLQHLDLSSCGIRSIEANTFDDLPLTELNLGRNFLQEIPSELVHSLKVLYLNNNQIEVIRSPIFQKFSERDSLDLSNNRINHIESGVFATLHVKSLNLRNNSLEVLQRDTFQGLSVTLTLDLGLNRLREISMVVFRDMTHLKEVYLDHNQISVIRNRTLQNFHKMKSLDFSNNQINQIEPGAFSNLSITSLNLRNNSLEVLQRDTFQGLLRTKTLDLGLNRLREISKEVFRDMTHLKELFLDHNQISVIRNRTFQNFHDVVLLDLGYNQINHIESGAFYRAYLGSLDLRNNSLEVLQNDAFQGITVQEMLNLAGNKLQEISSEVFCNIRGVNELYLNDNEIKLIRNGTFQNFRPIISLDLSNNQISQIEPGAFTDSYISLLNLSNNSLEYLQRDTFPSYTLGTLNLGSNKFQEIPRELFPVYGLWAKLYLNNNQIKVIRAGTFQKFFGKYLDLNNNQISHIEKGSFRFPNTIKVNLLNNPINHISTEVDAEYKAAEY